MMSITVWRSPSRLLTSGCGGAALTPSVESIVPLPSWSIPRPPAGKVTGPAGVVAVYVPSGPKPGPTTLIAIVARPAWARDEATTQGAPFLESVNPCPKMTVGQPPAGAAPDGTKSVNWIWFLPCGTGVPVAVPYGGITFAAVS